MAKKLCKLVKDGALKEDMKGYSKLVKDARYVCKNCGRVAAKESHLCKSKKL